MKGALAIGLFLQAHEDGPDADPTQEIIVIFNSFDGEINFKLPLKHGGEPWSVMLDTSSVV